MDITLIIIVSLTTSIFLFLTKGYFSVENMANIDPDNIRKNPMYDPTPIHSTWIHR